jgi:CheY-like chemotaxis protein
MRLRHYSCHEHDDTCEMYTIALASSGFETMSVHTGADAYARAWETCPDIIVTEVSLPDFDGWPLLQALKRDPRTRTIPVVVVTSSPQAAVRERAMREGCSQLLVKPCFPETLASELRRVLSHGQTADATRTRNA